MRLIDADAFREQIFSYYACVNEDTSKSNYKGETLMAYEVADMIEDCLENAPTVQPEPGWISVKDRLPEDLTNVLAYGAEHNNNYGAYLKEGKWCYFKCRGKEEEISRDTITHWMPLPSAPKEEACD